jgi:hypothetical protein
VNITKPLGIVVEEAPDDSSEWEQAQAGDPTVTAILTWDVGCDLARHQRRCTWPKWGTRPRRWGWMWGMSFWR